MKPGEPNAECRGIELLLAHCAALADDGGSPSPLERLREAVGYPLARLLVSALTDGPGRGRFRGRL